MKGYIKPLLSSILLVLAISGCNLLPDWMGKGEEEPLPGERISVLSHKTQVTVDEETKDFRISLPAPEVNNTWTSQDAATVPNAALYDTVTDSREVDIGDDAPDDMRLTSTPVLAHNAVYTLDGKGRVTARRADNIDEIVWENALPAKKVPRAIMDSAYIFGSKREKFLGGNIAYGRVGIFVTTARGKIYAFGAITGKKLWERSVKLPIKTAPVVHPDGIVFFVTVDNKLYALNNRTGETLWTHSGIEETTSIHGAPAPAISKDVVVVPHSSGELYALAAKTGKVLWSDALINTSRRVAAGIALNDITATPVIHDGRVFAVSHDGVLTAFELYSGKRLWNQDISSSKTPWVAGEWLFMMTTDDELVCIHTLSGKIKWVTKLQSREEPRLTWGGRKKGEKVHWSNPVLAGNSLLLSGSHGTMAIISPYTGEIKESVAIQEKTYLPPVVAQKRIFILSNKAVLKSIW